MQETESSNKEINNGKLEIVYKLHGARQVRELGKIIKQRVLPIREEYPYAEIRIEVDI